MFERKAFVSHSSKNKEIADHFCSYIARLGVKDENIFCSSVIGKGIDNGQQLNKAIADAITKSSLLIFILSYDFLSSSYWIEELGVGWFLAQRGDVMCFYLVLPDIDMSDIQGFVNSKVDKFTFLDNNHVEDLSSLSCDLSDRLRIRMKSHTVITNAENVLLSSIKQLNSQLIIEKEARRKKTDLYQNEVIELKKDIIEKKKDLESFRNALELAQKRNKEIDARIELSTLARVFENLGFGGGVTRADYTALSKSFWFDPVNRYEELLCLLDQQPSSGRMEKVVATIYLSNGNQSEAYAHFLNYIQLSNRYVGIYDIENFAKNYDSSMKDIIEILQAYYVLEKEGIFKDDLYEVIDYLNSRESNLST